MKRLSKYLSVALIAIAFYAFGFVAPWDLGPKGTVSIAEATHDKGKGKGHGGGGGGPPPTVSELPIQYMVFGGIAFILMAGGIFYLTRNRSKSQSPEV